MDPTRPPSPDVLPTSRQLLRSTALAAGVAAALLITTVLPAEYGLDPTGLGRVLGLQRMGEVKASLAHEATRAEARAGDTLATAPALAQPPAPTPPAAQAPAPSAEAPAPAREDTLTLTLRPDAAAEVKLVMRGGARATFRWSVQGGHVNYDTHGDPMDDPNGYHGYGKGKASAGESGVLEAAFDGRHGWYWRNRSGREVTVTLHTEGAYADIQRVL